ncbi:hypothetical protein A5819_001983 [Enterococcus sp. 7E2_DIV0204]|uniref:lipopolysaccharide biosynthesis protein n=1 Tax=Enterococcus sp. 7E2_DIV0204 TaxID=1834188 RepID=UPI000A35146B|nr:oligosaccharide flippase family protein [Enterococcus sp. 7E2_DIV0204]OTN89491.1 hypothetical protein A5819_001983 [Enterococcus sp. 7E2_DIV0204]
MSKYQKLINNSIIFTIGNFGSKLLLILLVPLYTYSLTPAEYGSVDLLMTTVSLLLPIVSLNIFDGVIRFVMDKNESKEKVFTNSMLLLFAMAVASSFGIMCLSFFFPLTNHFWYYLYWILILQALQTTFAQFARGIDKIKVYALSGVLLTFATAVLNIVLLVIFKMGIQGYLISLVLANIITIVYLACVLKIWSFFNFKNLDKQLIKRLLIYSLPLIPNAIMWWLMNASSRYFVVFFIGSSANGLLAVANKIPSLISLLNTIFMQAWQMSAIEEFDSKDKSVFYSKVFNYFSLVMLLGASGLLMILKPLVKWVINIDFYNSWEIVPPLLLAVVYSSYSGFLGTNYIAAKKTQGVFFSSIIGALASVILNLLLIPSIGTSGVGISSMVSFFLIFIIRYFDTKKFIHMTINIKNIIIIHLVIILQIVFLYLLDGSKLMIVEVLLFFCTIFISKEIFILIFQFLRKKYVKKDES